MSIKTKAQLAAEANANINTNGTNAITGAVHNTMLNNTFDSVVSIIDAETINGVKTFGSFPVTPSAAPTTDYQVANKKYVDDKMPFKVYRSETTLTAIQVGALGVTPAVLLAAPGASNYYNILNVTAKVIVTTQLEVGGQVLQIGHNSGSNSLTALSNSALESPSTVLHYCWLQGTAASAVIKVNDNFGCVLSGGVNPSSGSAEIRITIYYTIETY